MGFNTAMNRLLMSSVEPFCSVILPVSCYCHHLLSVLHERPGGSQNITGDIDAIIHINEHRNVAPRFSVEFDATISPSTTELRAV